MLKKATMKELGTDVKKWVHSVKQNYPGPIDEHDLRLIFEGLIENFNDDLYQRHVYGDELDKNDGLLNGNHITATTHCEGEGMDFSNTISMWQLIAIDKFCGTDIIDDLTLEHPITISLQTPEQHREASINGLMWDDGLSRKLAERVHDGETISDEEYENDLDETDISEEQKDLLASDLNDAVTDGVSIQAPGEFVESPTTLEQVADIPNL